MSTIRARDDPLEGDTPYVEGEQIEEDEEEEEEDVQIGAYEDEIYGTLPRLLSHSLLLVSSVSPAY